MTEEYYIEYYDPKGRRGFTKYINMFIWQGLTEEEKQQVKGILE